MISLIYRREAIGYITAHSKILTILRPSEKTS